MNDYHLARQCQAGGRRNPWWRALLLAVALMLLAPAGALAGGGGQNMLLVVDPADENALRLLNAYQQVRAIPESNILFIPSPPLSAAINVVAGIAPRLTLDNRNSNSSPGTDQWMQLYLNQIDNAITDRGLTDQIDFITMVGGPQRVQIGTSPGGIVIQPFASVTTLLQNQTQLFNTQGQPLTSGTIAWDDGRPIGALERMDFVDTLYAFNSQFGQAIPPDQPGAGMAVHHGTVFADDTPFGNEVQFFMGGILANTGPFGTTVDQAIASFTAATQADGTKPQGTIFLETSNDIRTVVREGQFPSVEAALQARGISVIVENNTPGGVPLNEQNVRGAVAGKAKLNLPNGSTYLSGTWSDNLTSFGALPGGPGQSLASQFIAAGAAATSGSVAEPGANSWIFPHSGMHLLIDDGLTLGEAFMQSVRGKVLTRIQFIGDALAQPYAGAPSVTFLAGTPDEGEFVSGSIQLVARGIVAFGEPFASGVDRLELYIDGKLIQTVVNGTGGSQVAGFQVDTTQWLDGYHELRIVAVNDAASESESFALRNLFFLNEGNFTWATPSSLVLADQEIGEIMVGAIEGDVPVWLVLLHSQGRLVGGDVATSLFSTVDLDASLLAYGDNLITPSAILTNGEEIKGEPITVTRQPDFLPGQPITPVAAREFGIKVEYFLGKGGASIDASDFTGTPDIIADHGILALVQQGTNWNVGPAEEIQPAEAIDTTQLANLAIRVAGRFEIAAGQGGEYQFLLNGVTNTAARLLIDDELVIEYSNSGNATIWNDVFLDPGEHDFTLLVSETNGANLRFSVHMRGADGVSRLLDDSFVFTVP